MSIHDQDDTGWQLGADAGRQISMKLTAVGLPLGKVVEGKLYRGVLTGLNDAFIVSQQIRDELVKFDVSCSELIKPLVNEEDVRTWHVENENRWLILLPDQWTKNTFGSGLSESAAWARLEQKYPSIARHLAPFAELAQKRTDQGQYWWELRPCNYYADYLGPKMFWPEIANRPRFAIADPGIVGNKTTFMIPGENYYLLGLLSSRALWFVVSHIAAPFGERKGILRYLMSAQFIT
ncbi:MAG: hypothetical protein H7Z42_12345 [Roseiflexaceae bacterium]|nr:hypothetical protein [Roseiflexaceae bacterium]